MTRLEKLIALRAETVAKIRDGIPNPIVGSHVRYGQAKPTYRLQSHLHMLDRAIKEAQDEA